MRLPLPDALRVRHQSAFATHQSAASCSAAVAGLRVSDYRAGHRRSRSGVPGRSIGGGHRPHPIFQPSNGETPQNQCSANMARFRTHFVTAGVAFKRAPPYSDLTRTKTIGYPSISGIPTIPKIIVFLQYKMPSSRLMKIPVDDILQIGSHQKIDQRCFHEETRVFSSNKIQFQGLILPSR